MNDQSAADVLFILQTNTWHDGIQLELRTEALKQLYDMCIAEAIHCQNLEASINEYPVIEAVPVEALARVFNQEVSNE